MKDAAILYLLGRGPLDGKWYGEGPPRGKGPHWWRAELRKEIMEKEARIKELEKQRREVADAISEAPILFGPIIKLFDTERKSEVEVRQAKPLVAEETEIIKLDVRASTSRVGSEVSEVINVEIGVALTPDQREEELNRLAWEWVTEQIDYGYTEVPYYED